jgi:dTDP-L-rhamnose 4-epimerase
MPPRITSVYALSKYDQEQLCLTIGRAYGMETVALRFFNVYGERQALSNPYTGALAIFAARLRNGEAPLLFEDGAQRRDFVSVHDVARACRLALETPAAAGEVLNVGSGRAATIADLARKAAAVLGRPDLQPRITNEHRAGDIRHCFADISRARAVLGYEPTVSLDDGIAAMGGWLRQESAVDNVPAAMAELTRRGLVAAGAR